MRTLALSLISAEAIVTTEAKAKELRPFIERLVTRGRSGTVAARRLVAQRLGGNADGAMKLVKEIAPRYKERQGGYTRITKMRARISDGSPMARIEFV